MSVKTKRRILFFVSIAVLCATLCTTVFATSGTAVFTDVSGHWAESYINQAYQRQLVEGYNGLYCPDDSMTRAEMVTMLWRSMGEPKPAKAASFTDLTQDWYKDAVAWADEQQVVNGIGNGKFDPNGNVTREQLATILYRLSGGASGMENLFTSSYDAFFKDSGKISAYAKSAVYWCYFNSIYSGEASVDVGETLAPNADATRGQIAVMLVCFLDHGKAAAQ